MKKFNLFLIIFLNIISLILIYNNYVLFRLFMYVLMTPIFFIPYFIDKYTKFKIKDYYKTIYIIFIYLSYFLGFTMDFYNNLYFYDKLIHFLSGFINSLFAYILLKKYNKNLNTFIKILFIISFSSFISNIWEVLEYISDLVIDTNSQHVISSGVDDTMQDIIMSHIGTFIFIIFIYYKKILKYIKI